MLKGGIGAETSAEAVMNGVLRDSCVAAASASFPTTVFSNIEALINSRDV